MKLCLSNNFTTQIIGEVPLKQAHQNAVLFYFFSLKNKIK